MEDIPHNQRGRIHRVFNAHVSIMKPYVARRNLDRPRSEEGSEEERYSDVPELESEDDLEYIEPQEEENPGWSLLGRRWTDQ